MGFKRQCRILGYTDRLSVIEPKKSSLKIFQLRSSFTKAFSRSKLKKGDSDADESRLEAESVPASPLPTRGVAEGGEQVTE